MTISSYCRANNCVQVDPAPGGGVYVSRRVTGDGVGTVRLRFTAEEWEAFLLGVAAGEFTPEALRASESLPRVAGISPETPCSAVTSDLRGQAAPSEERRPNPKESR